MAPSFATPDAPDCSRADIKKDRYNRRWFLRVSNLNNINIPKLGSTLCHSTRLGSVSLFVVNVLCTGRPPEIADGVVGFVGVKVSNLVRWARRPPKKGQCDEAVNAQSVSLSFVRKADPKVAGSFQVLLTQHGPRPLSTRIPAHPAKVADRITGDLLDWFPNFTVCHSK
jgi:hypothetical protein